MIFIHRNDLQKIGIPYAAEIEACISGFKWTDTVPEEIEIKGRDLFVRPSSFMTRDADSARFEAHRIYADVQYVAEGVERMQFAPSSALKTVTPYDVTKDIEFFTAEGMISNIVVPAGYLVVFLKNEGHRPCCHYGNTPSHVKKLVFKVSQQ
jgi:biofilm protein TabA